MAMVKKLGKTLQTGVTSAGIDGLHEQTGNENAGGEAQVYYDKDGTPISVYQIDGHTEYRWTAIMETSVANKEIGDPIEVPGTEDPCYVMQWDVSMANNDVKRVNIGARNLPGLDDGSSSTTTTTTQNGNG